tara:strand:- start:2587 stop:2964 length:378 start_codon:yes stop_codon:yes gene_type:complete
MSIEQIVSLRLVRGASRFRGFTLNPDCSRALFRVGSAIECNWQVQGPGVAPHHLMLLWKGGELTLVDVGAGHLYVDGESFILSRTIVTGTIAFASAAIVVERLPKTNAPATMDVTGAELFAKNSS